MKSIRIFMVLVAFFLAACLSGSCKKPCEPCTETEQQKEYDSMVSYLSKHVTACETTLGFLHYDSPGYYDRGNNDRCPGNCADWAAATWNLLKGFKWNCWNIVKIRAREKFSASFHNFVYIEPKCGGAKIYMDPFWTSGKLTYTKTEFEKLGFTAGGFLSGAVWAPRGRHNAGEDPK